MKAELHTTALLHNVFPLELDVTMRVGLSTVEKVCLPENAKTLSKRFCPWFETKNMPDRHRLPEGLDEVEISELMEVNESLKNFDVEVIPA